MTKSRFAFGLTLLAAFAFTSLSGCDKASTTSVSESSGEEGHDHDDHDGHDHSEHDHSAHDHGDEHSHDFASIVEIADELTALNTDIGKHFGEGDPEGAHDPLHHVGEVLLAAEQWVAKMDDADKKAKAQAAVDSLLDDFTAVDDTMHEVDDVSERTEKYDSVKDSIQKSIDELKGLE
ncbi:hypothetical protein [Rhodopirellula sp. MGV]|uniref:hypothetical protein n=1 Tax=Rhodopirellula sp. MGV TaxID=2023130 RepID=UPI000B96C942|nr:hypothetical protein [Rhodopirellula sp. MGV]OYP33151.1 hypothetical protein CGZ80_18180 [Rhodopirellula sp. MGV]PNY35120.1 hypothetical protein C2E31_19640 [Rhodopirellula baltica]